MKLNEIVENLREQYPQNLRDSTLPEAVKNRFHMFNAHSQYKVIMGMETDFAKRLRIAQHNVG
ncbi:MAG: hypothetical protein ACMXYA_01705, partial [Candidatus Woesearchaeota archaeon]